MELLVSQIFGNLYSYWEYYVAWVKKPINVTQMKYNYLDDFHVASMHNLMKGKRPNYSSTVLKQISKLHMSGTEIR